MATKIPYESGMEFGRLTLIEREVGKLSILTAAPLHTGWWKAKCTCGHIVRVSTRDLRNGTRRGYSCDYCPRPKRRVNIHTRRPQLRYEGKTFGRLVVGGWVERRGWECQCSECGGTEWVNRSRDLGPKGSRQCKCVATNSPHTPLHTPPPTVMVEYPGAVIEAVIEKVA